MATLLHKYDKKNGLVSEYFDAEHVQINIDKNGWFSSLEALRRAQEDNAQKEILPNEDSANDQNSNGDDPGEEGQYLILNDLDLSQLENDDIREVARAAGIPKHDKKRVKTLRKELKALQKGGE